MAAVAPANPATTSNILSTQRALLDTLISFLTVSTHHILFLRRIYPPVSFVSARAYNYPVRQNRHPDVCNWINDAIDAIRDQMERNTVDKIAICIFECGHNQVLERWTFDLHAFPHIDKQEKDVPLVPSDDPELSQKINAADMEANFRATLSRISNCASKLRPLPDGDGAPECSFTITMEVKDKAERPVGRIDEQERQWVAAEPGHFGPRDKSDKDRSSSRTGASKTHPVRRLDAGQLQLEVWVEEAAVKFSYPSSQVSASERNASMSYGAGTEKFNPSVGYELEPPDVNRKPGGGIGTDYQRG